MDDKLVESYLDFIAGKIVDEDKIVTYKSLSRNLNVHVNTAKQLLYIYLTNEKSKNKFPISATYLIAGKVIDGSFNVSIVNESDLKEAHSKLIQVTSQHVYSIQKGKNLKDVQCLCGVNKESATESCNPVIKHFKNVLKQKEQIKKKSQFDETENKKIIKKALLSPIKKTISNESNEKVEIITKESEPEKKKTELTHKKTSPKKNSEKTQANAKKPAGNISNLFAKANQKNSEKAAKADSKNDLKSVPEIKNKEEKKNDKSNEKETSKRRSVSKESLNGKSQANKRRRIQMLYDSEESGKDDDDDDDDDDDNDDNDDNGNDNDNDDNEKEQEREKMEVDLEEQKSPPPPAIKNLEENMEETKESVLKNKRKKRKVIDKTVMNEDGYLETKKEIVFETDSENETEKLVKPKEEKKPKVDKEKGVQGAKKQSSLFSFFNKKG